MNDEIKKENEKKNEKKQEIKLVSLAMELGFSIALPLVGLALLGRMIDRWWETSPWFLLAGILLSMFVSIAIIYRKVKDVLK